MKDEGLNETVCAALTKSEKEALERACDKVQRTISQLVRIIIRKFLKRK